MDYRKQAAINSVGSVVLMFGQWLISVLLVRMSGYEDAGIFSLAMTVSNMFNLFANYGLRNYQVADVQGRYTQDQYILARIFTSVIAIISCVVYLTAFTQYTRLEQLAVLCYLLYNLCNTFSDILFGFLQLHDKLQINGYSNIVRGGLCFAAFVVAYSITRQIAVSLFVMMIVDVLWSIGYDWRQFSYLAHPTRFKKSDMVQEAYLLRDCFSLMIALLLPGITTALPRLTIKAQIGTEELGYFSTIFTPTVLLTTLVPSIIIAMVPKMARAWSEKNYKQYLVLVGKNYLFSLFFLLLAEVVALLMGRPVMKLVFGPEILDYYSLLYWAILATGLNLMASCGNSALISIHCNSTVAAGALLALGVAAVSSWVLVRSAGIAGGAYALALAYLVQSVFQTGIIVYKTWRTGTSWKNAKG